MSDIIIDSILHKNDFLTLETRDKIRGIQAELTKLREERKAMCWALTSIRSMSQPGAVLNPAKTIETIRNIANDAVEALAKHKQSDEKGG